MSDKAEQRTKQLRQDFGGLPQWETAFTRECLDNGDTEWSITIKYHEMVHENIKYRSLARTVHRMCKRQIGKHPSITEDMIKEWLAEDDWTDAQVRAEYQRQFDDAQLPKRNANKLVCEMRRDYGDCHWVSDTHVRKWMKRGLTEDRIRERYQYYMIEARLASRAAALRYRLEVEVFDKLVISNAVLLEECRGNPNDDAIVDTYWIKFARAQEDAAGGDVGDVQEGAVQEGAAQEGAAQEGAAQEGAAQEGAAQEGAAQEGAAEEG